VAFNMGPLETRERARVALNNRMRRLFRVNPRRRPPPHRPIGPDRANRNRLDPLWNSPL